MNPKAAPPTIASTAANLRASFTARNRPSHVPRAGGFEVLLDHLLAGAVAPVDAVGPDRHHAALGIEEVGLRLPRLAVGAGDGRSSRIGDDGKGEVVALDELRYSARVAGERDPD